MSRRISSTAWTGRGEAGLTPPQALRWWLIGKLYPGYECQLCVGQDYGCYCEYYGAIAPGCGPERWRVWLRSATAWFTGVER